MYIQKSQERKTTEGASKTSYKGKKTSHNKRQNIFNEKGEMAHKKLKSF